MIGFKFLPCPPLPLPAACVCEFVAAILESVGISIRIAMKDLKERAVRGGFAKMCAQAVNLTLRVGSLMILARLLDPEDFGLVAMVTALTGVLQLFRDFGLSTATVQRTNVTEAQISTLFWINLLVGVILTGIALAGAPLVADFYHEPRLIWVTVALAASFLINAAECSIRRCSSARCALQPWRRSILFPC